MFTSGPTRSSGSTRRPRAGPEDGPGDHGGSSAAVGWARETFGAELGGRSRTAATCRRGWSATCSPLASGGAGAAEDDGRAAAHRPHAGQVRPDRRARRGAGALREPDLPVASHDEVSRELKLLVDRREDLVQQRTATINRLLWRVHELDPAGPRRRGHWTWPSTSNCSHDWLGEHTGLVAELARDELAEIIELTVQDQHVGQADRGPRVAGRADAARDARGAGR